MNSPTKKRAGDDDAYERRGKRQATTPPRLTRAMLRKLNENGGPPVELNPGLDMAIRRRSQGTRPPKRAAQDEAVGSSVKRTSKTRKKGRGAKSQPKRSQIVEPRPTEPRLTEPQSTEPRPIEPQHTEPQSTESQPTKQQFIQVPPTDQETRISEADVAAASRLAQAAMAAGLTGTSSEAGSPVVEGLTDLVCFTTEDLRTILSETVMEDEIRLRMEPHWLARMEFLTWLERPAADMHRIKGEISRLAARWSRDLRNHDTSGVEIPISTLELWRADITIVSDPGRSVDSSEARNEGGNTSDEKEGAEKEGDEKESDTEVDGTQAAVEVRDETEGDEEVLNHDRSEVIEALAESVTLMARDMAEWKEAFGKEMTAEPDFRSKRAWDARISESQREAITLETKASNLDICKSKRITKSAMQAAEQLLDELQKFRIGLRMDREAFWDEFDQEGAELLLKKTEIDLSAEEEVQEAFEDVQEAVQEDEARDIVSVKIEVRMTDFEAGAEEALTTESEELRGPSTGSDGVVGVKSDPTEEPFGEEIDVNNSNPTTVLPEQPSVEETTVCGFLPVHNEESTPPFPSRTADLKSESDVARAEERNSRSPFETYAGKGITSPRKGEESAAQSAAEIEHQDREPQAAEAGEKLDSRESTPWLPDKRGSHSPAWKWPPGERHRGEEAKVNDHDIAAAVEEDDWPPREGGRDTSSGLFSSRSASAEQVSNEEENRADNAMSTSDGNGIPQEPSSISSSTQPQGPDGGDVKIEDTADQTFTASRTVHLQEQDTSSLVSSSREVSPDIIVCEAHNPAESSPNASNVSSLPEDASSSPGRSEAGEDVGEVSITEWAPSVPSVPRDTSLPQRIDLSTEGVRMESTEENRGGTEDTVDSNSSTSKIARLLEEVSLPHDRSSPTTDAQSGNTEELDGEPREEIADQASSTNLPQATSPIASGIRSGSDTGAGSEAEDTVEDHAATPSDAASLAQGSSVGEDPGAPPAVSIGESPVVVPNVRYIKPQWEESLFSPEEPAYTANDYSANEVDDEDNQEDEFDEVDDREADDVDP